jgi:hypothetical protein
MSSYKGLLVDLLEDGTPRPKLSLILRARARARNSDFVIRFEYRYRQFGEETLMSPEEEAALEKIASGPVGLKRS